MPPTSRYPVLDAPAAGVRAEMVGPVLTLCAADDEPAALRPVLAALPDEPGRVAVVSAPGVTGRRDFFEVLPELVAEHLGGVAAGVRVVPIGRYTPAVRAEVAGPALAEQIGQPVVLPADAVHDVRQVPTVWLVCAPGRPVGTEPLHPKTVVAVAGPTIELPVVTQNTLPSGVRTPAGLSFVDEPAAVGVFPALGGTVIEVPKGFTAGGRLLLPRALAAAIAAAGLAPPYVVVSGGGQERGPTLDLYLGSLADALAGPVVAADAPVSLFVTGLLVTSGTFWRWHPRAVPDGGRRVERLGSVLPVPQPVSIAPIATRNDRSA